MADTSLRRPGQPHVDPESAAGSASGVLDGKTSFSDQLGRSSRRQQSHIVLDQPLGEIEQACLVVDREDG